ncbi:MAG: hypothetical protein ABIN80_08360 [Dyadobacter sp.]|uniref:hypothetical protein n=1 Tax=Dyadobacter sp. TaxID=1914288 RepID=UPI003262CEF9
MKKLIYLSFFVLTGLLVNCKKDSEILVVAPKPEPEKENLIKAIEFLKGITVTGAEKIEFDSVTNSYMVSLPDSYDESKAEVKVSMQKNIMLWDSAQIAIIPDSIIRYSYKGTNPLHFKVSDNPERSWFYFNVYFNFSGTPKIDLLSKEIPVNASGSILPLRYMAKVGSIPAAPGQYGPTVKIINRKTGFTTESHLYSDNMYVNFPDAQNFITRDPLAMEISLFNQKSVVFEGIRFIRDTPQFYVLPDYKFEYSKKDTIKATGGFFLPDKKYSVTFTSDFLSTPVTRSIRFNDASRLTLDDIPAELPEGPYLVSFYEDDKLLGKSSIYKSNLEPSEVETIWNSKINAVENIWKGDISQTLNRNTNVLSFRMGDVFFVRSLPLAAGYPGFNFDVKKLPSLRLKNAGRVVELKPELEVFNWGIAGVSFAIGKYTIPKDLATGSYEVTSFSAADGKESKPYWSKMEIR